MATLTFCASIFAAQISKQFCLNLRQVQEVEMSFISVSADSHFPIQNLPYGVFSTKSDVS